ncbi:hypothetical protein N8D56_22675 [Devosia sp. A8/3-2]|nr:hypothetical protein N8D56_22675 [Devosia sp. A8/3-2]
MRINLAGAAMAAALLLTGAARAERLTDKPLVDAARLTEHLDNDSPVILDIRDVAETVDPYAADHVPGAIAARYSEAGWRVPVNNVPGMLPPTEQIEATIAALGVNDDSRW